MKGTLTSYAVTHYPHRDGLQIHIKATIEGGSWKLSTDVDPAVLRERPPFPVNVEPQADGFLVTAAKKV